MQDESIGKIVKVALGVCIVCSVLVSTAAVTLNDIQTRNQRLDKVKNILLAGDLLDEGMGVEETYDAYIRPVLVELATGKTVPADQFGDELNVHDFDVRAMAEHPELGVAIPQDEDIAQIKRKPKYMVVYQVMKDGELQELIFPIYGKGLWSTLYGFMALSSDLKTIEGLTFYEHGETPGLGGEVDNPRWKSLWKGKQAFDDNGQVAISVIKGRVDPARPEAIHQVDGLSGATITTRGVDKLIKYWLGEHGYGPYLNQLRAGGQHGQA